MAVRVFCSDPSGLLNLIKAAIRKGTVETWSLDDDGDFTHNPPQWRYKAWLRPKIEADKLTLHILGRKGPRMSGVTYGVYHGRFIEMLLTHFDTKFTRASATALPVEGDNVSGT